MHAPVVLLLEHEDARPRVGPALIRGGSRDLTTLDTVQTELTGQQQGPPGDRHHAHRGDERTDHGW